ncbi:MAG: hypothetical protein IKR75_08510, partial [Fibrobacter sp.]|nr:hypothetical protein [Fibrobacter sp.]
MNLKTSLALTLASVAFAMAQDAAQPATSAAEAPAPAVAEQPAAAPAATAPAAPESVQPAPAEAPAEVAQPTETAAPAAVESAPAAEPAKTAAPAQPAPEAKVAEAVPPQGPAPEAAPGEAPVRMGPPKTPFTVLHGNAYNRVQNEAAGDNVDALLNKRLTKLAYQKFFYIEPTGEKGVVSLGGFFGAMDISGELGRATAGYATPGFAIEARLGLGQIKTETKGADIKETVEGDDWGLTLSKTLGGYVVTLSGDWITFAKETNVDPVRGPKTEQRYRDLDASLIVTDGPSARKHFWSAGVAFNRHEDELESGGTLIGDSLTSN